jgi:hypothetical protein
MHFSRRRNNNNPGITLQLGEGMHEIEPTPVGKAMRWLGVWLDRKLSFKHYVGVLISKAKRIVGGIKALGNTVRGAPPRLLVQAALACVLPVLCYGAEAWWPGQKNSNKSNQINTLVNKLEKVFNEALWEVLPVYKITPISALHREAGTTLVELALDHRSTQAAARLKRLDTRHPLVRRTTRTRAYGYTTRLLRTAAKAEATEQHNPLATPPWERQPRAANKEIGYILGRSKEDAALYFTEWLKRTSKLDLLVFIDGS